MELAFVFLHVDCPKFDRALTASPPKFGLQGSPEEGLPIGTDKFHFQCSLCAQRIDVTIEDTGQAKDDDEAST